MIKKIISTFARNSLPYPDGELVNPNWPKLMSAAIEQNLIALENSLRSVERRVDFITQDIAMLPTGAPCPQGALCVLNSNGQMIPASNINKEYSRGLMGISINESPGTVEARFLIRGFYDDSIFAPGDLLWVSDVEGQMTATRPEAEDVIGRLVGYKLDNGKLFFNPDATWIETRR